MTKPPNGGMPLLYPSGMAIDESALSAAASIFESTVEKNDTPGMAWGLLHEGTLVGSGGFGNSHLENGTAAADSFTPDSRSLSRICSMTKSFTAASILKLRDEGRLRLDDPVSEYVPEAAAIEPATEDSPELTLRLLLTMSAGFVTDNPWGDRMESMTRDEFADLLKNGLGWVHAPGTGFEYSNTGYSLLGRVIDEVSGQSYDSYITEHFLQPLGMTDTIWSVESATEDQKARIMQGHRLNEHTDATRFERIEFDTPGVYGAMAGLFSTVEDVAKWVQFLSSANLAVLPGGKPAEHPELLSAASRREMQQLQRLWETPALPVRDGEKHSAGFDRIRGYGYGLVVERFADLGELVSHSGGYPGFGSYMIWHRATGTAAIALANAKYGPAIRSCMDALRAVLEHSPAAITAPRGELAPVTATAFAATLRYLSLEDMEGADGSAIADEFFAENMDPDIPRDERFRRREQALQLAGLELADLQKAATPVIDAIEGGEELPATVTVVSRANAQLKLTGPTGTVTIDMLMDPRRDAKIQSITTLGKKNEQQAGEKKAEAAK